MTRLTCRPRTIAGRRGYTVKIKDLAPEPFRSELLAALACIASGVLAVVALEVLRYFTR